MSATTASARTYDVAIVGGGPAGLTASIYLARFLRSVVVLDAGQPRADLIPLSRNCPGYPDGISGKELLRRLRSQASGYGSEIVQASVLSIERRDDCFALSTHSVSVNASFVILATGLVDRTPEISGLREGIAAGIVGLCPVCDGYEARRKRVGVVGQGEAALKEAQFLLTYSSDVFILARSAADIDPAVREQAAIEGIGIWDVGEVKVADGKLLVSMPDGSLRDLDMLYSAMGCRVRSELASQVGAECDRHGYVRVGTHLETSVPGLYAIGDVVQALNQLAVGFGHAAIAATDIHNALRDRGAMKRETTPV